jgi:hypothetical protein
MGSAPADAVAVVAAAAEAEVANKPLHRLLVQPPVRG